MLTISTNPLILVVCGATTILSGLYFILVFLSPPLVVPRDSEKRYRSIKNPESPEDLEDIRTSDASVDLSIIIPAFNEVPRLPSMLSSTIKHLSKPQYKRRTCEILIVDDGSTDGTAEKALELARKYSTWDIRIVSLEKNLGKGGAVRHGMMYGRGRRLLMVDADGASRFEDLEVLWKEMDRINGENVDAVVVIGSRAHLVKTEAVVKRSVLRNIAMYALHLTLRIIGVGHVRDTQCGFKLFSREAAQILFPYQHLRGWIFDVEVLLLAKQQHIPVAEVPINWTEVPESKLRLVTDSLKMFWDLLVLRANQVTGRWTVPHKKKIQ